MTTSRWPKERLDKLLQLEAEGLPLSQMARELNCTQSTVQRHRAHLNLPKRVKEPAREQGPRPLRPGEPTLPPLPSLSGER